MQVLFLFVFTFLSACLFNFTSVRISVCLSLPNVLPVWSLVSYFYLFIFLYVSSFLVCLFTILPTCFSNSTSIRLFASLNILWDYIYIFVQLTICLYTRSSAYLSVSFPTFHLVIYLSLSVYVSIPAVYMSDKLSNTTTPIRMIPCLFLTLTPKNKLKRHHAFNSMYRNPIFDLTWSLWYNTP